MVDSQSVERSGLRRGQSSHREYSSKSALEGSLGELGQTDCIEDDLSWVPGNVAVGLLGPDFAEAFVGHVVAAQHSRGRAIA